MADTAQEELIRAFEDAAGEAFEETLAEEEDGTAGMTFEAPASEAIEKSGGRETQARQPNSAPRGNSLVGGNVAQSGTTTTSSGEGALGIATSILEGGLGIVPLALDLIQLFDGGSKPETTFAKFAMPDTIEFQGDSNASGEISDVDFDEMGAPRDYSGTPRGIPYQATATTIVLQEPVTEPSPAFTPGPAPQPTPQVSAAQRVTDPQWFIENAAAITAAVRSQMLNLNSINDMINDL